MPLDTARADRARQQSSDARRVRQCHTRTDLTMAANDAAMCAKEGLPAAPAAAAPAKPNGTAKADYVHMSDEDVMDAVKSGALKDHGETSFLGSRYDNHSCHELEGLSPLRSAVSSAVSSAPTPLTTVPLL